MDICQKQHSHVYYTVIIIVGDAVSKANKKLYFKHQWVVVRTKIRSNKFTNVAAPRVPGLAANLA